MIFKDHNGKEIKVKNACKYLIDWDKKSLSKFQKRVKDYLRPKWEDDYVYEEFPVGKTRLRFDFLNISARIVVESDGVFHNQISFFSDSKEKLIKQFQRDHYKEVFCELNNIQLIRIREDLPIEDQFKEFNL